jgi:hypothetical protein
MTHKANPTYHPFRQIVAVSRVLLRRCADCGDDLTHVVHSRMLCWAPDPERCPCQRHNCTREAGHGGVHATRTDTTPMITWSNLP